MRGDFQTARPLCIQNLAHLMLHEPACALQLRAWQGIETGRDPGWGRTSLRSWVTPGQEQGLVATRSTLVGIRVGRHGGTLFGVSRPALLPNRPTVESGNERDWHHEVAARPPGRTATSSAIKLEQEGAPAL